MTEDQAYTLGLKAWVEPMPEEMKAWPIHDGCDDITIHVPPGIIGDPYLLDAYCAGALESRPKTTAHPDAPTAAEQHDPTTKGDNAPCPF